MGVEIERRFLVAHDDWRASAGPGRRLSQGYLASDAGCAVRVRVSEEGAWLTLKGPTRGATRAEYEYAIPLADGRAILDTLCTAGRLDKTRHLVEHAGRTWEVDVFHGVHSGLVLAEIELLRADESVALPPWLGPEVTDDARYHNAVLARSGTPRTH